MKSRAITAAFIVLLTACSSTAVSQTPQGSEPSATEGASSSPEPTVTATAPVASPSAVAFPPDSMVRAVVPGIALRIAPGLSAELLGTLPDASRSFVVSGPMKADGYEWIQLAGPGLPPASGCATFPGPELTCPTWFGWAATGTKEGDAWFVLDPSDCPDPSSDPRAFMMLGNVEALHCYGDDEIELTGWIPGPGALRDPPACDIANDVPAAWLFCPDGYSVSVQANDTEAVSIEIYVDPQSNVELAYPGNYPMVSGRLDHPDARGCDAAIPAGWPVIPAWVVLDCRTRFVVTAFGGRGP